MKDTGLKACVLHRKTTNCRRYSVMLKLKVSFNATVKKELYEEDKFSVLIDVEFRSSSIFETVKATRDFFKFIGFSMIKYEEYGRDDKNYYFYMYKLEIGYYFKSKKEAEEYVSKIKKYLKTLKNKSKNQLSTSEVKEFVEATEIKDFKRVFDFVREKYKFAISSFRLDNNLLKVMVQSDLYYDEEIIKPFINIAERYATFYSVEDNYNVDNRYVCYAEFDLTKIPEELLKVLLEEYEKGYKF
jgi:hypothetical protein